ncbi:hypothetical protein EVA_11771 [gut metagenome]|uniref:Uncharacterized protein n=1 Tax=gut metagenome TaxID=749906 RepID=J9FZX4_9ZZZZ
MLFCFIAFGFCNLGESNLCRVNSSLNIFRSMSEGDEVGFKLRRRQINALLQHGVEVDFEGFQITGSSSVKVYNRLVVEKDGEHTA